MEKVLTLSETRTRSRIGSRLSWPTRLLLLLLSIAFVAIPVFLIQPFRPQTQRALQVSYLFRTWSPLATVIIFLIIVALTIWSWNVARRWWLKASFVIIILLAIVPACFARQNLFE